jgi:hypothetical protein
MGRYTIPELFLFLNFIPVLINTGHNISIYLFPFFWRCILVSLLRSILALLNSQFEHCCNALLLNWSAELQYIEFNCISVHLGLTVVHIAIRCC